MRSVMKHSFAQVPRANIPRSQFNMPSGHKTTIDADYLYPVYIQEVLPGDTPRINANFFARMTTPIYPLMDNLFLDSFWFYAPTRTLMSNWEKFLGAQDNPGDSIDFTIPKMTIPSGGFSELSLADYLGLPPNIEFGSEVPISALPFRFYNKTWNDWFRDQNLQDSVTENVGAGPDNPTQYTLLKRGKRHDYFTSCLPNPQKGDTAVSLPLGTQAPVISNDTQFELDIGGAASTAVTQENSGGLRMLRAGNTNTGAAVWGDETGLVADLSTATAATINAIRLAVTTQQFLEADARGGTRINELILSHFGVVVPDYRVQRVEYLGGASHPVGINPIPQTSSTDATTPQGNIAAFGTAFSSGSGFNKSFTEHGYIMCLVNIRADLTYQQGVHRHWTRQTRFDYFWPEFQHIGEQVVSQYEIEAAGDSGDDDVFGYQERFAEYKFMPSRISGKMRSAATGTLHAWHLSENLSNPQLNDTFIQSNTPMTRVLAVSNEPHFILDCYFNCSMLRPMALYGTPGLARF